jgi:hypothetical protein
VDASLAVHAGVVTAVIRIRGNAETPTLVRTALRVASADLGRLAIIGGVAVTCRLQQAHRATVDVDTVAEDRLPSVLEVLQALPGAQTRQGGAERVEIEGVVVDIIATGPVDKADIDDPLDELFVRAHRFALDSAELVAVVVESPERVEGDLPLATPAGLVATKLAGVQSRWRPPRKKASDGYDLYRLLEAFDQSGEVARGLLAGGEPVSGAVRRATQAVLIDDAAGVVRLARTYGVDPLEELTVDRLLFAGERLVDRLDAVG